MFRTALLFAFFGWLTVGPIDAQRTNSSRSGSTKVPAKADQGSASKSPARFQEDWTKLSVDRAEMNPNVSGVVLGKAETSSCTRELIRLEWRHGDPIDIYVLKPQSTGKPHVILYLYSFPSDTDRFMDDGWCQRNTLPGLAAVGFTSVLTGQRFHNRPMKEWFISELQETMGKSTHDVQLILDYLATRGDLSVDSVGMFGQGSGASIAILAASVDSRITTLDLLDPWGDWPDWMKASPIVPDEERTAYLSAAFLQKAEAVDPVSYLPQLKDRKVRLQQVMDDKNTPDAAKAKIAAAAPSGSLVQFRDNLAHREAFHQNGLIGWLASQMGIKPITVAVTTEPKNP